jgi:hypothetical protein
VTSVYVLGLGRRVGLPGPLQSREATPSRRALLASPILRRLGIGMAAAARAGFRRLFSVSAFAAPPPPAARPAAEPCNNLFVSGNQPRSNFFFLFPCFGRETLALILMLRALLVDCCASRRRMSAVRL